MKQDEIFQKLTKIASSPDFPVESEDVVTELANSSIGVDAVDPILKFMEDHPTLDFGMPGPLVHFVETFYRKGYEEKLLSSLARKPIMHTVWMLNRIINGTTDSTARLYFIRAMEQVTHNSNVDADTKKLANELLTGH